MDVGPKVAETHFHTLYLLGFKKNDFKAFGRGEFGESLGSKRELLGWKHLGEQIFGEERLEENGNEGGECGSFTQIC